MPVTDDSPVKTGLWWTTTLWTAGGFIAGVLLNGGVEAAGIAITGDWNWGYEYNATGLETALPYATALLGLFVASARRNRRKSLLYRRLAIWGTAVIAMGIGFVLFDARSAAPAHIDDASVAVATTTTSTQASPSTTNSYNDQFERSMYCLENIGQDTSCDGEVPLRSLLVAYYWFEKWQPLWKDAREAFESGDITRTELLCELGLDDRSYVEERVLAWPPEARRFRVWDLGVEWLQEMEIQIVACARGEWETVNVSQSRNYDYLQDFCFASSGCPSRDLQG